ncbi:MAG: hypothetical protein ACPGQL_02475 [Thermoplasmatota archaeon]
MDHTPTVPATDDRPLKLLERADVDDDHRALLLDLVRHAQQVAVAAGAELQSEFGKTHVALIVGCQQFLRIHRAGDALGRVELLLDAPDKEALAAAGFELGEPEGQIFKLFGWTSIDPRQGEGGAAKRAAEAAFRKAQGSKAPAGPGGLA